VLDDLSTATRLSLTAIVPAALFLLALNPRSVSEMTQLPIGPLVTLGFAAFVAVHVVRARTTAARGASGKPVPLPVAALRLARGGQ